MDKKFHEIFEACPVAIIEADYGVVLKLGQQLREQTVTNIRQYLIEQPALVKKALAGVRVGEANAEAVAVLGVRNKKELAGQLSKVFAAGAFDLAVELFVALLAGAHDFSGEFKLPLAKRQSRDVFARFYVPEPDRVSLARVLVTLQDISHWKKIERQLNKRAQLDGLTNLLNHLTIMQRLDEELVRAKRYGLSLSCLMIDLDHFKVINDKFGHQRGDVVLKKVAAMIKGCVRKSDVVGRYGGDEFLIILPETTEENAVHAAARIQKIFMEKIFRYQKPATFHISLSIGIAGYPSKNIKDVKDFIALADQAMYAAKKAGRNRAAV